MKKGGKNDDDCDTSEEEYIPSSECPEEYDEDTGEDTSEDTESVTSDPPLFPLGPAMKKIKTFHRSSSVPLAFTFCLTNPNQMEDDVSDENASYIDNEETRQKLLHYKKEVKMLNSAEFSGKLEDRVYLSHHTLSVKAKLISKLSQNVDKGDRTKIVNWVNEVLKLPLGIIKPVINYDAKFDINSFLFQARKKLDKIIYGMYNTKEEILDFLVSLMMNPGKKGTVLALKGPKGVGKTKLCRALSDILNLPFFQISMGGLTDSNILIGHDSTYVGAKCGRIANIVQDAQCMNFILYIDEMDKCGNEGKSKEVQGVLTHLFDESQNTHFQDLYFEGIPIDLSNVFFITSFNNIEDVDPIVLNRMKVLEIGELSVDDKVVIAKEYTLPEINYNKFKISEDIIRYVITCKTIPEEGMRNVNKNLETLINRLNTYYVLSVCENSKEISKNFSYENLNIKTDENDQLVITEQVIDVILSKVSPDESWRNMYI